jgi:signal peptidase
VVKSGDGRLKAATVQQDTALEAGANDLPFESTFLARLKSQKKKPALGSWFAIVGYVVAALLVAVSIAIFSGTISARVVLTSSMQGTINPGDVVVAENWLKPKVGQIAIYQAKDFHGSVRAEYVHRVIAGSAETEYTFKGDNNPAPDVLPVKVKDVVGVVIFWIPKLGSYLQPAIAIPLFLLLVGLYFLIAAIGRRGRSGDRQSKIQPLSLKLGRFGRLEIEELSEATEVEVWVASNDPGEAPIHLLLSPRANRSAKVKYLSEKVAKEGNEKMDESNKSWVRSLLYWVGSILVIWLVLAGLSFAKVVTLVHPQVGPQLPIGGSNSTIVAFTPGGKPNPGQLAMATFQGKPNVVRVTKIAGNTYAIDTMDGSAVISKDKLDGPIDFFIPFIGYLWLPFGQ